MASTNPRAARVPVAQVFDGLVSFAQLEGRISRLPSNQDRGDAFEIFAEAYFATQRICEAKEVWPFDAIPRRERVALGLDTGRDMGVDGVYTTTSGEHRPYQVKFRAGRPKLTWEELSTFMGLSDRAGTRVLITNCDALPELMADRTGFFAIRGTDLDRLGPGDFEAIRNWLTDLPAMPPRKTPLPHQQEALAAVDAAMLVSDRATVVMACGTGKTLVALWAAERSDAKRVLVLVPSLALVRQLLHEWLRETSWERLSYLCVCSDPTVSQGVDSLVVRQADLDFPVTTDAAAVRGSLARPFDGVKVVFSTYQSARVVAEGMDQPFQLAIFDEAHKTAGREGARLSFALDDKNLPAAKRIFFTATPRHYDIRKRDTEGEARLLYSMDNTDVYGPVAYTLPFARAARLGLICDYKVVISVVANAMVDDYLLSHGEVLVEGNPVRARQVALQIALQRAVEQYGVRRIFTFHGSVAAARSFTADEAEGVRAHLASFETYHVNGMMPTSVREQCMTAFRKAPRGLMSNARCLTEGVDVPAVDMVAFMSPRKSKVDIVQATGRAMRRSEGKAYGYVLVPLFLELEAGESVEEAVARTDFGDVWDILSAMREQDDVLADVIRQMREDQGRGGGLDESPLRERLEVLGPDLAIDDLRRSISVRCVERLGSSWDARYGELLAFLGRFGHSRVPAHWPENPALASWAASQPARRRRGQLSLERIARLDAVDFDWDRRVSRWEGMFAQLLAFKERHGHCDVSREDREFDRLAFWLKTQRDRRRKGLLSGEREMLLESAGLVWNPLDDAWELMYGELAAFKKRYGHLDVPSPGNSKNALGTWMTQQRDRFRRETLEPDRQRKLDALGFSWNPIDEQWVNWLDQLRAYKAAHGHCNVAQGDSRWPNLGAWLTTTRMRWKKGRISPERMHQLEELGFDPDPFASRWGDALERLRKFKELTGHTNVPKPYPEDPTLSTWTREQRTRARSGVMTEHQRAALETLGFSFDPYGDYHRNMLAAMEKFHRLHGHVNVPARWEGDMALSTWVSNIRQISKGKKTGQLPAAVVGRLNELGFVWEPYEVVWGEMFDALCEVKKIRGDCNIPQDYVPNPKLGRWVFTQRALFRKERLRADRKSRLDKLGFRW